jgi:hypothetical protein
MWKEISGWILCGEIFLLASDADMLQVRLLFEYGLGKNVLLLYLTGHKTSSSGLHTHWVSVDGQAEHEQQYTHWELPERHANCPCLVIGISSNKKFMFPWLGRSPSFSHSLVPIFYGYEKAPSRARSIHVAESPWRETSSSDTVYPRYHRMWMCICSGARG